MAQIPLALELDAQALFETFVPDRNAQAVAHLKSLGAARGEAIWLAGPAGTGKSHLLQAACRRAGDAGLRSMYLPLAAATESGPDLLQGLETLDLVTLDDCDVPIGDRDWELALFSLFKALIGHGGSLVMAARLAPSEIAFELPDLGSRACGAALYRLHPIGEPAQLEALHAHARRRGLSFDDATATYLLTRVARDAASISRWLERLDRASLRDQRRLTIPFVRQVLSEHGEIA